MVAPFVLEEDRNEASGIHQELKEVGDIVAVEYRVQP